MTKSIKNMNGGGGAPSTPFLITQPFNLAIILSFYSPIIVAIIIVSMSFIFQNFKGLIYLLWLIIFTCSRSFAFNLAGAPKLFVNSEDICTSIEYSHYGNGTFSMFFIAFSFVYICGAMFLNQDINFWLCGAFLFYLVLDIWVRNYMKCVGSVDYPYIFLNLVLGTIAGIISISSMYATNTQKFLFFNEISSSKDVCSMPKKQTFKCSVYKNGELVGSTNK